jgi:hypothetical protein
MFGITAAVIIIWNVWWLLIVPLILDFAFTRIYPVEEYEE